MTKRLLPRSLKKYIRREKARLRQTVADIKEQGKLINELYKSLGITFAMR